MNVLEYTDSIEGKQQTTTVYRLLNTCLLWPGTTQQGGKKNLS